MGQIGWLMADACTTKDEPFFDKHRPKAPKMPETPTKRNEEIEPIEPNEGTNRDFLGCSKWGPWRKGPNGCLSYMGDDKLPSYLQSTLT